MSRSLDALRDFEVTPHRWQREAIAKWTENKYRGTVSVVTGGGKTVFAFLCMRAFASITQSPRFLVIVPSVALLDQWVYAASHEVGLNARDVAVLSGPGKDRPSLFNVAVINSARRSTRVVTHGAGSWFLCVDECHRAGSPANAAALQGRYAASLGLSATPRRQYDLGFEEAVAPAVGDVVYEYSFADGVRDGVVAPFALRNYRIPFSDEEAQEYSRLTGLIAREMSELRAARAKSSPRLETLTRKRASVIITARWRVPAAVHLAAQTTEPTIVFHERIRAANEIARLTDGLGRRSVAYHSGLSPGMRQRNLALFREGIASVLVTCRSLDEGLNVPEATVGILAASTRSLRQRVQRLGRVIRRSPGKQRAVVATLYASDVEELLLMREASRLPEVVSTEWLKAEVKSG